MDLPRVTEILKCFTSYSAVPKDILDKAASRGTSVHALCAGIAKGNWIPDSMIDDELIGYVNSFKKWSKAQVKQFTIIEKRYSDEILGFAGQLDYVVIGTNDELYLVDLKTSSKPQKTYPVQMAAYDRLLKNNHLHVKGAIIVYLNKDGEFPEVDLIEDLTKEFSIFMSALDCYKYFNKRKKNARAA